MYSRKVEYLHKLVFNALEAVATKRCGSQRTATECEGNASEVTPPPKRGLLDRRAANAQDAGAADDDFDDTDVDTVLALDDVLQGAHPCARV